MVTFLITTERKAVNMRLSGMMWKGTIVLQGGNSRGQSLWQLFLFYYALSISQHASYVHFKNICIMYITFWNVSTDCCCEWQDGTFCSFFIIFIKLLENVQSSLTFFLYDKIILRERTLKKNSFLSLENVKDKPPPYRQERRQGGGFAMHKLIIR